MEDRKPFGEKHPLLALLLIPVAVVAALIAKLFDKPIQRTPASVVEILENRLSETPDWHEWDEFICVSISDERLESIRHYCASIDPSQQVAPTFLGPEDRSRLCSFIEELRSNNSFKPRPLRGLGRAP